jgi:hypothetical protein
MKKLYVIGGVLLGLGLVGYIIGTFFLGSIVKSGVNRYGPKLTQTRVALTEANISPLSGKGSLRGLSVDNPKGWSDGRAFYLGNVSIDLEPFSVFGDHIVINEVSIDQPEFTYERRLVSSNINDLLKNIEDFTGGGQTATTKTGQPIKFVVKKFRLTNGKATLVVGQTTIPLLLPPISLDNLGVSEGGITPGQFAAAVMQQVLGQIATASAQALAKDGGAATVEKAKEAVKSIKKLFGEGK